MKKGLSLILAVLLLTALLTGCSLFGSSEKPLSLDKTELDLTVGDTYELSSGGATKVNWKSSDDSVATVNGGVVSAKKAGSAVVTASLEDGSSQTCSVTVADKLIQSITLDAKSIRLEIGKTIQLSATYSPADASEHALSWSSSDEYVATVDSDGYVTGVWEGTANIICRSSNGVEAVCSVTVSISIAPTASPTEAPTQASSEKSAESKSENKPDTSGSSSDDFIFPDSSVRYLSEYEISARLNSLIIPSVTGDYAQDAINEIFARNGYVFRTPSIRAYYESKSWYHADPSFTQGDLSDIETYNIALLSNY